jgi:hypothetical protein
MPVSRLDITAQVFTLAQILAALTIGNRASAFALTVISSCGNSSSSFFWYLLGSPTVSTYTWERNYFSLFFV